jgi:hypothetical protein
LKIETPRPLSYHACLNIFKKSEAIGKETGKSASFIEENTEPVLVVLKDLKKFNF